MNRIVHLVILWIQGFVLWLFISSLRSLPDLHQAFDGMFGGKPLPPVTQWVLNASEQIDGLYYQWPYLGAMATVTYLFIGILFLYSSTNQVTALGRSYIFQSLSAIALTVTALILSFAVRGPLTYSRGYMPATARQEFIWITVTAAYCGLLILLGILFTRAVKRHAERASETPTN